MVIDHLPQMEPPKEAAGARARTRPICANWASGRRSTSRCRRCCAAWTAEFPRIRRSTAPGWIELWDIFGEDRLLYGSDWPNSDQWAAYPKGLRVVREYFMSKGPAAAEKYFWKNSVAAYRWVKRDAGQPRL